jgi:hypothetical protein
MSKFVRLEFARVGGGLDEHWINMDEVHSVLVHKDSAGELVMVAFRFGPEKDIVQFHGGAGAEEALKAFQDYVQQQK